MQGAGNTAVTIILLGVVMLLFVFTFTDAESVSELAVEAVGPQIIGAVGGVFSAALRREVGES